ncbi:MAG: type II secretion system F family protein [[Clostridium] scindens]
MIYMFRSAESGGNLDQVALKMAELYEKDHKLNTKVAGAMIYPKILAGMIVAVILVLTKYVMPQFQELFEQMDTLPLSTRILNSISDFMQSLLVYRHHSDRGTVGRSKGASDDRFCPVKVA